MSSAAVSSRSCGTGTGGDRGGGVFGLLRLGAGGVVGWCGDLSRPGECRVGPLQAWCFVVQKRLRRKSKFPVCRHWSAHFVVPPFGSNGALLSV